MFSEEKQETIDVMLKKAETYLESANDEFISFRYGIAVSQAYYCVFHTMTSALYSIDLTYSKHSGVISAFSEHFIKTKIFDKKFGSIIRRIHKQREIGDYSYYEEIGVDEAKNNIEDANELLGVVRKYLART